MSIFVLPSDESFIKRTNNEGIIQIKNYDYILVASAEGSSLNCSIKKYRLSGDKWYLLSKVVITKDEDLISLPFYYNSLYEKWKKNSR